MAGFFLVAASIVSPLARESACLNLWARGQNSSAGQAAVFRSLGPAGVGASLSPVRDEMNKISSHLHIFFKK
jgi:hypothetical protein